MSYVVQSCCSIRVRNQLLRIVSDADVWYVLEERGHQTCIRPFDQLNRTRGACVQAQSEVLLQNARRAEYHHSTAVISSSDILLCNVHHNNKCYY